MSDNAVRTIQFISQTICTDLDFTNFAVDPKSWLWQQTQNKGVKFLLAHADDGVIWGKFEGNTWHFSGEVFPKVSPRLSATTLQQARLFGEQAELLIWRHEAGWRGRLIQDEDGDKAVDYYDEAQILWGDQVVESKDGFTLVKEGQQGLRHAVPLSLSKSDFGHKKHPLRLQVRHYLAADEKTGLLQVNLSRLVEVSHVVA